MAAASMKLPTWYRVVAVIVGVLCLVSALIVLADPFLALWLLIFLLGFALLVMGIDRLVAGISGHPFGPLMPWGPAPGAGTPPAGSTPMPPSGPTSPPKP